ncbi:2145_t:CDS:2 [Ambispora gerdemannii]|uniref:2145_t:CDS:1 n=1 Tax=Ambispora gerdemannii TaxID=144530 RepID=A0A9N8YUV5_9GLOM|nr:2145_t:CDS:2 [Ambispora gerdemannii]
MWGLLNQVRQRHFNYLSLRTIIKKSDHVKPIIQIVSKSVHKQQRLSFSTTASLQSKSERVAHTSVKTKAIIAPPETHINTARLLREAITEGNANLAWQIYTSDKTLDKGLLYVDYRNLAWLLKRNGESQNEEATLTERIEHIEILIQDMLKSGVKYDIEIYNALLTACQKVQDIEKLEQVWKKISKLKTKGTINPDSTTYCTLINTYAKQLTTDGYEKIKKLYEEIINQGCKLDSQIFASLINAFSNFGNLEAADHALLQAEKLVRPNTATFNAILKGYMRNNCPESAMEFLQSEMMEKWNCSLDIVTINIMIAGNFHAAIIAKTRENEDSEAYMEKARDWYLLMLSQEIQPSVVTFNTLIQGFGKLGKMDEVIKSVTEMQRFLIVPSLMTFRNLADVYGLQKDFEGVKLVWNDMGKFGLEPDHKIIETFVRAAKACNENEWAAEILKKNMHIYEGKDNKNLNNILIH